MAPQALKALWARMRPEGAPGAAGERLARDFLERRGFTVLARNFRCRSGEIDIVARDEADTIVFVEVKDRRGESHGSGHDAVTLAKRLRVVRAARLYAAARGLSERPLRFDVVSISWKEGRPEVRHDRGAFDSEGG